MSISGIGAYNSFAMSALTGGASAANPSGASASSASGSSENPLQYLMNYASESPAKRLEDAWLAQHHLTEQALAAMPPSQQDAIRKEMADDIKKQLLQSSGGAPGAAANIVV